MSRLIEEEFDELLLYVAGLKKTFGRKLDDHLFIIQQQNQRLDDQARLIDELAWQIRDLRASVRSVGDKLKVVEQSHGDQMKGGSVRDKHQYKCDYANVTVKRESDGGISGGGSGRVSLRRSQSLTKPRIKIINEEICDGVEILQVEDYSDHENQYAELPHSRKSVRSSYEGEGIYEPVQFARDYTAPRSTSPQNTSSLSAKHRQKQQTPLPPTPLERSVNTAGSGARTNRSVQPFYFPPPPPVDFVTLDSPSTPSADGQVDQSFQLRPPPAQDYASVQQTPRRIRNGSGSSLSTVAVSSLAIVTEETTAEEPQKEDFMRNSKSAAEREANSIKRRAYILPAASRRLGSGSND